MIAVPIHDDLVFAVVLDERNVQPPLRIALCRNFHQYFLEHRHVVALQKSSIVVLKNRRVTVRAKKGRVGQIDSTFHPVLVRLKLRALHWFVSIINNKYTGPSANFFQRS